MASHRNKTDHLDSLACTPSQSSTSSTSTNTTSSASSFSSSSSSHPNQPTKKHNKPNPPSPPPPKRRKSTTTNTSPHSVSSSSSSFSSSSSSSSSTTSGRQSSTRSVVVPSCDVRSITRYDNNQLAKLSVAFAYTKDDTGQNKREAMQVQRLWHRQVIDGLRTQYGLEYEAPKNRVSGKTPAIRLVPCKPEVEKKASRNTSSSSSNSRKDKEKEKDAERPPSPILAKLTQEELDRPLKQEKINDINATRCALRAGGVKGVGGLVASIVLSCVQLPDHPKGWRKKTIVKTSGRVLGKVEYHFLSPTDERFKSMVDIAEALYGGPVHSSSSSSSSARTNQLNGSSFSHHSHSNSSNSSNNEKKASPSKSSKPSTKAPAKASTNAPTKAPIKAPITSLSFSSSPVTFAHVQVILDTWKAPDYKRSDSDRVCNYDALYAKISAALKLLPSSSPGHVGTKNFNGGDVAEYSLKIKAALASDGLLNDRMWTWFVCRFEGCEFKTKTNQNRGKHENTCPCKMNEKMEGNGNPTARVKVSGNGDGSGNGTV